MSTPVPVVTNARFVKKSALRTRSKILFGHAARFGPSHVFAYFFFLADFLQHFLETRQSAQTQPNVDEFSRSWCCLRMKAWRNGCQTGMHVLEEDFSAQAQLHWFLFRDFAWKHLTQLLQNLAGIGYNWILSFWLSNKNKCFGKLPRLLWEGVGIYEGCRNLRDTGAHNHGGQHTLCGSLFLLCVYTPYELRNCIGPKFKQKNRRVVPVEKDFFVLKPRIRRQLSQDTDIRPKILQLKSFYFRLFKKTAESSVF